MKNGLTVNFQADKILINDVIIKFDEGRELVRQELNVECTEVNEVIKVGNSETDWIYQRRDVYKNVNHSENFFFLNYDQSDLLLEIEIHNCNAIIVNDFSFDFETELDFIASGLSAYSAVTQKGDGEYFFSDIKVSVLDKNQMGDDGTTLGYFYCAKDASHLEK
jgi:hypothetical protein